MFMSFALTMPQLRGEHQLHPIGLATMIHQVRTLLGLGLVPADDPPGPRLHNVLLHHLFLCQHGPHLQTGW
jgi:hypothetical protein